MSMIDVMRQPVAPPTALSRYTTFNGILYVLTGLTFMLWPYCLELVGHPPLTVASAGPIRGVGISVIYIGSFYIWGARSRFVPISLASVVNRVFLGPVLILPLVYLKLMEPMLGIPFCVLDVVLGVGMYVVWKQTQAAAPAVPAAEGAAHV